VTLRAFQRAMSDLVASADLCNLLLREPEAVLSRYDLTPRERRRLESAVAQRGMAVNCTLYRANRITPVYTYMPYTCLLLGDELMTVMLAFWERHRDAQPQFRKEIELFGEFLKEWAGADGRLLLDAAVFELAVNSLRFTTRRETDARLAAAGAAPRLHPLLRVVRLRHDPKPLLRHLSEKSLPPADLPAGEFWLLLDATGGAVEARPLDPDLGRLLASIDDGTADLDTDDLAALADAGLIA
jgi:hypothetical protein